DAPVTGGRRSAIFAHRIEARPARFARYAALVAHPAHVGAYVAEYHRIRLHGADRFPGARPVVVSVLIDGAFVARPAVVTVAAVGAIVPHFEDRPVPGEQLAKLRAISLDILRRAVLRAVAVPRRKIDAELHVMARRGLRDIAHHIALPLAPRALRYRVVGGPRRPQAEAVVMLAGQNHAAHSGVRQRGNDCVGIELPGVEQIWVFVAVTPFLIRERV